MNIKENCKNCDQILVGKYCSNCGQKKFDRGQKTISHLIHDGLHFLTHLEGNIFTTIKTVFTKPGQLSLDYSEGKQKRYFKPVSMFFMVVIIYLLFPFLEGMNMRLEYQKTMFIYGNYATRTVESIKKTKNYSEEQLSEIYRTKSAKVSKILLTVLIPLTVILLFLMFYNSHKMAYDHWLVALEFNTFYMAFSYLIFPILYIPITKISFLGFLSGEIYYALLTSIFSTIYVVYLFKRFYNQSWLFSVVKSVLFISIHIIVIQSICRFLQFQITIWLI